MLAATFTLVAPAYAQEPPDTVVVDSTAVVDSAAVADSMAELAQEADTVEADTIFYNLPSVRSGLPAGYATGVWEWTRGDIMASGALTLMELFQEVPGLIPLLGGDYGTPAAMSFGGQGGAGYRVLRDGFEVYPVDGGVADLQRIGLAGIARVRLERSLGRMTVELHSFEYDDGRPFSVIEAGTGDLDTNMFRGVFTDPTALFGSIGVGLERVDTRGRGTDRAEAGNRMGVWARYQLHLQDRAAIGFDFRRIGSQTRVPVYASELTRTDVMVRAGVRLFSGGVVDAYVGRSTLSEGADSVVASPVGGSRDQLGVRLGLSKDGVWVNGAFRLFQGRLPSRTLDVDGGVDLGRWGGVAGRWSQGSWNGEGTQSYGARAWLTPLSWATVFGEYQTGTFGSRDGPLVDEALPPPLLPPEDIVPGVERITDRETLRGGASLEAFGVTLAGAALYAYSDVSLPLATELDLGTDPVRGVHRNGYEGFAALPTPWEGLTLEGSYQWWDEPGPYLPQQVYRAAFEFHRVFKESENLEVWASVGVRGHDPMAVFFVDEEADLPIAAVPFYQSWYARIQVRIVTVRLWLGMDNFTFRRNLQTYPDRLLPYGRSFFALRWDMWN